MGTKQKIDEDLKQAMLSGDKVLTTTLRGLKSSILNAEIAKGSRDQGLPEAEVIDVLSKEAKKRQESADLYTQGGNQERSQAELDEKEVISKYLPKQLSDEEIDSLIDEAVAKLGPLTAQTMGQTIGEVKSRAGGSVDGAVIAVKIKQRLG